MIKPNDINLTSPDDSIIIRERCSSHDENKYTEKVYVIKARLKKISKKQNVYYRKSRRYKKLDMITKVILTILNATCVTSLLLYYSNQKWAVLTGLICSSMATLGGSVVNVLNFQNKEHLHNTTYLQLSDLNTHYQNVLLKNNLMSSDLDIILEEMSNKLGLIYDSALPIHIRNSESY